MRELSRIHVLPAMLERAPDLVRSAAGVALMVIGLLIVTRPLTSLLLLGVYLGVSCLVSGIVLLLSRRLERWWHWLVAALLIAAGAVILSRLDWFLGILPLLAAAALLVDGTRDFRGVLHGRASERVLAGIWGLARIGSAFLALAWPDFALLVIAVLFGVRTLLLGAALLWRSVRDTPAVSGMAAWFGRRGTAWKGVLSWVSAIAIVGLVVVLGLVTIALRDAAPEVDAFYDSPEEVPDEPGSLLRVDEYPGEAPESAVVQRILYTTLDANDTPALASALVIIPDTESAQPRPVIVWNHGTTGIARECAPSLSPTAATKEAIPAVEEAVAAGWVIVATDYSGQGTDGIFPYLIGLGEARSALDGVRAAGEIPDLVLADEVVVWGHSQGGHAALWTGTIAPEYTPDLDVVGTAAISPAADPYTLAERLTSESASALLAVAVSWVLIPYSETYDDVHLSDYVTLSGEPLVRDISQRCTSEPSLIVSILVGLGVSRDRPLYSVDLAGSELGARLTENKTLGPFEQPLLVAWGSDDEVIAADLQHAYVSELCQADVGVSWEEYPGYDHMEIVLQESSFLPVLLDWTEARLAGEDLTMETC